MNLLLRLRLPRPSQWVRLVVPLLALCGSAAFDAAALTSNQLVVRASGSSAFGAWPRMELRVDGKSIATIEVASVTPLDYTFTVPALTQGTRVDVVFVNDAYGSGQDRNLLVHLVSDGVRTVLPTAPGVVIDHGVGPKAFDGADVGPGRSMLSSAGALRISWPAVGAATDSKLARRNEAARFLLQASFGPTPTELDKLGSQSFAQWIDAQMALPFQPDFVQHVQSKFDLGADYRPYGSKYTDTWVGDRFWATAATANDQLRKRVAFALHHIFMVSQADSNLYNHARPYARYVDTLNRHAFGNYRALLEDITLSPATGIYLSHLRNRKDNPVSGRMPDENFAREVMQLFTIGLVELNRDGSARLDAAGKTIETYDNADVMALAKVLTGWSWGFPDNELTDTKFRTGTADYSVAGDTQVDLQRMRVYPGQSSTVEVTLFAGTSRAVTIAGSATPEARLNMALDALFNHPNVGPFIARQLIQQLVSSQPTPAYVDRVAASFNNNGKGVRGDLGAVVRAVLLDAEARKPGAGKLREPVLRVAQWLRAFGATSASGEYLMARELERESQQVLRAPSVFGWFRPGYSPPGSAFAGKGAVAPEFQIVNESTIASWVNKVQIMFSAGLGSGPKPDVTVALAAQAALAASGNVEGLVQDLNVLLFAGNMSAALRLDLLAAINSVGGTDAASHLNRARIAAYVAMTSPEFVTQR